MNVSPVCVCPICRSPLRPRNRAPVGNPFGCACSRGRSGNASSRPLLVVLCVTACLFLVVCVIGVPGFLLPALREARQASQRQVCKENLSRIGVALYEYHNAYGRFPPAYLTDSRGRAMHSWRVLLLPHLGEQALYDRYDFSEPWDSDVNRYVLEHMPSVYRCPSHTALDPTMTSFSAVSGSGCVFDGAEGCAIGEIIDGADKTLMVGEVASVAIPWTKPVDVHAADALALGPPGGFAASDAAGDVLFLKASGQVVFLDRQTDEQRLRNYFLKDDGDRIIVAEPEPSEPPPPEPECDQPQSPPVEEPAPEKPPRIPTVERNWLVEFQRGRFTGEGRQLEAARNALRGLPGVQPASVNVVPGRNVIRCVVLAKTVDTEPMKKALEEAGFEIGEVTAR